MSRPPNKRAITPVKLAALWKLYTAFKAKQLAPSTIRLEFSKTASTIKRLPQDLKNAHQIQEHLDSIYSAETTRRTLQQFNACCEWAFVQDKLDRSPFKGLTQQYRVTRHVERLWTSFEPEERDIIIKRFEELEPFFASWVKFLFYTGCRPEEAAALKWGNIAVDLSKIHFLHAAPSGCAIQKTKNQRDRFFPVNERLRQLLLSLKPEPLDIGAFVFHGLKGGRFNYAFFLRDRWKPLVEELVEERLICRYLPQYHCRHTFITLALEHLPINDVAYLSGNSPGIILKHYANRNRNIKIPEF